MYVCYSLEVLFLNNNHISKIEATDGMFPKLNYIRLDHNTIDNWDSLNALNQLPALTRIRCKGNSIFKGKLNRANRKNKDKTVFTKILLKDMDRELEDAHIVGRIKNLTTVNGNTVSLLILWFEYYKVLIFPFFFWGRIY